MGKALIITLAVIMPRIKDEDIKKLSLPKKDFISALQKVSVPIKPKPSPKQSET